MPSDPRSTPAGSPGAGVGGGKSDGGRFVVRIHDGDGEIHDDDEHKITLSRAQLDRYLASRYTADDPPPLPLPSRRPELEGQFYDAPDPYAAGRINHFWVENYDDHGSWPLGHRQLGDDGTLRGGWPGRPDLWLLRHSARVLASLWRGWVFTYGGRSNAIGADSDRDGDRGPSTRRRGL